MVIHELFPLPLHRTRAVAEQEPSLQLVRKAGQAVYSVFVLEYRQATKKYNRLDIYTTGIFNEFKRPHLCRFERFQFINPKQKTDTFIKREKKRRFSV